MKKIIGVFVCGLFVMSLSAQTKITKAGIVGKWGISVLEVPNQLYYDIEKDSLALGAEAIAQLPDPSQADMVKTMIKTQMAMLTKVFFQFNSDGTAEINSGQGQVEKATYTVDEANSTITTTPTDSSKGEKQTQKATMAGDKLKLTIAQPMGDMTMVLKKAK